MNIQQTNLFELFQMDENVIMNKKKQEKKGETKKEDKEERIPLPVTVRYLDFVKKLSPEQFAGNDTATLEEIRAVLEGSYPELEQGKCSLVYYKEKGFLVPVIKNGERKG